MKLDSMTTFWLWLGFAGMCLGTLAILFYWNKFKSAQRYHVVLALIVTTIAASAYFAMASGQAELMLGDKMIFFGRYIDWILTTPILLLSLITVALPAAKDGAESRERTGLIGGIIFADIAMIVTGAIANFSATNAEKGVWYVASCAWFLVVIGLMYGTVRRQAKAHSAKSAKTYTSLLVFLSLVWVWYPIVWLIGNSGFAVINIKAESAIYAVLDVTAKAIFGVVLLASLVRNKE